MDEFKIMADMRFWPTSGLGKVERAILDRKPGNAMVEKLAVSGKYGHPLSTYRIAKALSRKTTKRSVFWSAGFIPPSYSGIPVAVTVHDLTHLHYYDWKRRFYFNTVFPRLYRRCSAIFCVSEHTRSEFIEWSGVQDNRVHVTYNGVDQRYEQNRLRRDLGYKYILYVGNQRRYKNLDTLIIAFSLSNLKASGVHLVLTGEKNPDLMKLINQHDIEDFVHFIGFIKEEELPALYRGAELVSYISLYEGFGLPILEAMASGVPVVTSKISSMPEVAGDAAIIVDPLAAQDVAAAFRSIILDIGVKSSLVEKGLRRVQAFSWDRSAKKLWDVLEQLANEHEFT